MRRIVSFTVLALLLVGTLILAFNVRLVRAQAAATIYINSDGSVTPSDAPILSLDDVTYTFTGNMSYPAYNGVVVERNNTVIDGNGYTVQGEEGSQYGYGLSLTGVSNVTIENANVCSFQCGINVNSSNHITVAGNNVTASGDGIVLISVRNDTLTGNNAAANGDDGIYLIASSNNTISGNNATGNSEDGIGIGYCNYTSISGNNVSNSSLGVGISLVYSNNITVSGNSATASLFQGIVIDDSSNNTISGNSATGNHEEGIDLNSCNCTSVSGNNITSNNGGGIVLYLSSNITVSGNVGVGIGLSLSNNNTVSGNTVTNGLDGISLDDSSNNTVSGNDVVANKEYGILLSDSSSNIIYHNDFVGNGVQAFVGYVYPSEPTNTWDNGYPSGGNYWSDYNGTDLYSGPYQNETGSDGIGDTPYVIVSLDTATYSTSNTTDIDHFPLMGPFSDFSVAAGVDVHVVSNSTVSDFQFNGTAILFNVSGANGTTGFCNVCIPTALFNGTLSVFVNGIQVQYSLLPISNSSVSYLYFTYGHSTEQVIILPEFPDSLILAMFMLATLSAIAIHEKKHFLS
jgi:parallel beta-helix repeat protein